MADFSFGIKGTVDLYSLLIEDYEDFKTDKLSSKFAMRCAMDSWHIVDWLYKEFNAILINSYPNFNDYRAWVKTQCPQLAIMQDITNGSKHNQITFYTPQVDKTEVHHGAFSSGFSRDFDVSTLDVHMKDGTKIYFEDIIEPVINFWHNHLTQDLGLAI